MINIIALKNEFMELSDLIAAAALRQQKPSADEISTRQAYVEFDRKWIEYHVGRGHISPRRNGEHKNSPLVFSRMELLALKKADREGAKMLIK